MHVSLNILYHLVLVKPNLLSMNFSILIEASDLGPYLSNILIVQSCYSTRIETVATLLCDKVFKLLQIVYT